MQPKGDNSSTSGDILMKLHLHHHTMVIYVQYSYYLVSIVYLIMSEDGNRTDVRTETGGQTYNDNPISLRLRRGIIKDLSESMVST